VKVPKSSRTFLEPDMVVDLLDVADAWERSLPAHQRYGRRAFLATLCLAGPRISELTGAQLARLGLRDGGLQLGLKAEAGIDRHLELSAYLIAELRAHVDSIPSAVRIRDGAALPLFPTRPGGRLNPSNVRNRLLRRRATRAVAAGFPHLRPSEWDIGRAEQTAGLLVLGIMAGKGRSALTWVSGRMSRSPGASWRSSSTSRSTCCASSASTATSSA
jgi:integrase